MWGKNLKENGCVSMYINHLAVEQKGSHCKSPLPQRVKIKNKIKCVMYSSHREE